MRQLKNDTIFEKLYHLPEMNGKYQKRRNFKGGSISMRELDEIMN